ncbi:MAG: substrate-binding periplasmic protein [Spirochaetaceae bacterium]
MNRFLPAAACLLLLLTAPLAAETLVFVTSYSPPYSNDEHSGILERVLTEAGERIGVEARFRNLPAERALSDANAGFFDGVVAGPKHMVRMYHHLVRIRSASIESRDFVAFSRRPVSPISSWDDLAAYNITYVRGWKTVENHVPEAKSNVALDSTRRAFELLARDRTDVVVGGRLDGTAAAARLDIDAVVQIHEPPLASMSLYPYLHRKNARYVIELARALDDMKADGSFDRIYAEAMDRYDAR